LYNQPSKRAFYDIDILPMSLAPAQKSAVIELFIRDAAQEGQRMSFKV
jgi:hypothetical protein